MAYCEKSIEGSISQAVTEGTLDAGLSFTAVLKTAGGSVERDYEKLSNKPMINGVELISDKSFEDLGDSPLSNFEILEIFSKAGF